MEKVSNNLFLTPEGREISLSQLHLLPTHAGCWEGTPETNSPYIRKEIRRTVNRYLPNAEALVVLDDGQAALPEFQWIAEFCCRQAVRTTDPDYCSHLGVCWFTSNIPNALTEVLQAVIDKVDYEANAEDYDMMP